MFLLHSCYCVLFGVARPVSCIKQLTIKRSIVYFDHQSSVTDCTMKYKHSKKIINNYLKYIKTWARQIHFISTDMTTYDNK